MRYTVRTATLRDLPELRRLAKLHEETDEVPLNLAVRIERFKQQNPAYFVSVASRGKKLVGVYFTTLHRENDLGTGKGIFVDPKHRQRGVSDALLLHAIKVLKSNGAQAYSAVGATTLGQSFLDRVFGETKNEDPHAILLSEWGLEKKLEKFQKENKHVTFQFSRD